MKLPNDFPQPGAHDFLERIKEAVEATGGVVLGSIEHASEVRPDDRNTFTAETTLLLPDSPQGATGAFTIRAAGPTAASAHEYFAEMLVAAMHASPKIEITYVAPEVVEASPQVQLCREQVIDQLLGYAVQLGFFVNNPAPHPSDVAQAQARTMGFDPAGKAPILMDLIGQASIDLELAQLLVSIDLAAANVQMPEGGTDADAVMRADVLRMVEGHNTEAIPYLLTLLNIALNRLGVQDAPQGP